MGGEARGAAAAGRRLALLHLGGDEGENLGDTPEFILDPRDHPFWEPPAGPRDQGLEKPHQGYLQALDRLGKGWGVVHAVLLLSMTTTGKRKMPISAGNSDAFECLESKAGGADDPSPSWEARCQPRRTTPQNCRCRA